MPELYLKEVEPFITTHNTDKHKQKGAKNADIGAQKVYSRRTTKRSTSLIACDALLLCLELLQVLALMQAMALKWFWPVTWIKRANFIFFVNADIWEYIKVDCHAFVRVQGYDVPSSTVKVSFEYILYGWAAFFGLLFLIWLAIKLFLHFRQPAYLLVHNARLERAVIVILQIFALPLGASVFKVFHCASGQMSVDNSVTCWSGLHWAYVVSAVVVGAVMYVAFPAWLVWRIRREALAAAHQHHEDFLKLKEVEYMSGLDVVWAVRGFHIFSSFRLCAIYYRPVAHIVKFLMLIAYAATFQSLLAQAVCIGIVMGAVGIFGAVARPFRITAFNVMLVLGCACLVGDAVYGGMLTQYNAVEVESPWLVEPYSLWIMVAINGVFLIGGIVTFLIYLLAYRFCCQGRCVLEPLWPVMPAYEYEVEGVETQKYLAAVLRGRAIIERCRRLPAIFAPVHELAHQIHVLNAYMRESELMQDGLHPTLWAVLDEMIDMHQRLEPKSLFGEMVHESIRKNAAHFMTLMPMFAQRLAQRDYDLILLSPLKKRLLLKMYIIAVWMDGCQRRKTHQQLTQQVLARIWEESPDIVAVTEEREYREDLYPETIQGPDTEALYTTGTLDMDRGLYDLNRMEVEEESLSSFLKRAPPVLEIKEEQRTSSQVSAPSQSEGTTSGTQAAGAENPAFIADEDMQAQQTLTTSEPQDMSEAPPNVLVDLEVRQEEGDSGAGETMELSGFQPGESSTDIVDDAQDDSSPDDNSGSDQHQDTGTSTTSSESKTSVQTETSDESTSTASSASTVKQ
ncbi:hypothetical protein BaRGS_00007610 [Batillaria attramentaria]|uniref:Uncharacterized protein n=1 Tax=Batillaria attramentaria TaxID=370345 RepID=A0ABD0LNK4_9CAEN